MATIASGAIRRAQVRPVIRVANHLGQGLRRIGLPAGELSETAILRGARRQTGLEELGDQRFRRPLRLLLESYDSDPELTFVGRMVAQGMLIHHVANRMRIHRDLQACPEILAGDIRRPLFVVGLPRTGTTLLYNLLAQDRNCRPLLFWETMSPSPPPRPESRHCDPRIKKARRTVQQLDRAVPGLRRIHTMTPDGPDECLGLLWNTFVTPFFRGRLPQYRQWLYQIDDGELLKAYHEYRNQLLLLQLYISADHWLLKCPSHLFGLQALMTVFPDACIVQTHRDLAEAVPSLCSLTAMLDGLSYRTIDMHEVGRRDLGIVEQFIQRSMKARAVADGRVLDVHYAQLLRDPLETVRQIYRRFEYLLSDDMEQRLEAYLADNPRGKHGFHEYRLEDFGLDHAILQHRFAAYYDHFGINLERGSS